MAEPSLLVVRLGSLGDILHTFPAVAALRESFPSGNIVWLTHPRWKMLVEYSALASSTWTIETRSLTLLWEIIQRTRKMKFAAAIDYQGLWKSASLPFFGGVKRRIGFSSETIREWGVPILYTERVRTHSTHVADQNGELSLRAGAKDPVTDFRLYIPPEDETSLHALLRTHKIGRYVVLTPGGGWRSKCWPSERFAALAERIQTSLDVRCIVNYGPGEDELAVAVRPRSQRADILLFNGELGKLMALLRGALCVVGGDTGPLHLAVALGTPVVALFGPTDPARNGPYGHGHATQVSKDIVLRAANVVTTHRRGDEPHPSMLEITVNAVFDAVKRVVESVA
jgi:heptosyltransferase-1